MLLSQSLSTRSVSFRFLRRVAQSQRPPCEGRIRGQSLWRANQDQEGVQGGRFYLKKRKNILARERGLKCNDLPCGKLSKRLFTPDPPRVGTEPWGAGGHSLVAL